MPNIALSLHLLFESLDPNSFWRPYIDVLPRTFTLPLFFRSIYRHFVHYLLLFFVDSALLRMFCNSVAELDALQASPTAPIAMTLIKSTVRQYLHFQNVFRKRGGALGLPSYAPSSTGAPFTYEQVIVSPLCNIMMIW
jgi:hypothetical protein